MDFDSIDAIRQSGFEGFVPISTLQTSKCCEVPDQPGVYLVLRRNRGRPEFLNESTGGYFKGKNPSVAVSVLEAKWVDDALVLNIGKAGPGKKAHLRGRLIKYMELGPGKTVGRAGGRYIWQLRCSFDLLVCWKVTPDAVPRIVESGLIREFEARYRKLPFANISH